MSWKLLAFGIAVTVMVCDGQFFDMEIKSISRQKASARAKGDMLIKVCTNKDLSGADKIFILGLGYKGGEIGIEDKRNEYVTEPITDLKKCRFFLGDILSYKGSTVFFTIQVFDGSDTRILHAEAKFDIPGEFIVDADIKSQKFVGIRPAASDTTPNVPPDSLRLALLNKSLGKWKVCADETIHEDSKCDANNICYAIEAEAATGASYSLCIKATDGDAKLHGVILSTVSPVTDKETIPDGNEVLLTYGYEHTPRTDTVVEPFQLKITYKPKNKLEFVPYKNPQTVYAICQDSEKECPLENYNINKESMNIIIMNVGTDKNPTTSNIISFKDYGIMGTSLGTEMVEVYWDRGEQTVFGAHVDEPELGNPKDIIHDAIIDCSSDDPDTNPPYCFAYFIGLTPGATYSVTVAPTSHPSWPDDGNDFNPIEANKIKTVPIPTDSTKRKVEVILLQDSIYPDGSLQVCYKASADNHNNTRHEAILIDEEGHWIKLYQSTQMEKLIHCFSPVNLLTSSLRVTKDSKITAVIVERELNGYKVLDSGQADVDLSALRVIKPEIDNSSEGYMSTLAIVGAAIGGVACLMALVVAAIMIVMKRKRNNDGLQYPLHRTNIENSNITLGLDSPYPTM